MIVDLYDQWAYNKDIEKVVIDMNRKELYQLVDQMVNDLFHQYQAANGIESGDIDPMEVMVLDEIQNKLTDLIISVNESDGE